MTNNNDRNRQIRAKNLFEEETPEESISQKAAAEENVQSIRSSVMKNMQGQGAVSGKAPGQNVAVQNVSGDNTVGTGKGEQRAVGSAGKNPEAKMSAGRTAGGVGRLGRKDTAAAAATRQSSSGKGNKKKKSPRQKQEAHRLYACAGMAVFVVFVVGWGICQLVRTINLGENQKMVMVQPGEQVVDNSANAGKAIDVDKMVTRILDNVTFEAELNPLEDSVASGMIATTDGTDLRIYMGNGTYADELVVMTALSEADAERNQQNAEEHLAEMHKQFNDYIPKEAKKIDDAVKVRCGCYVVVCVTNDTETAQKIIDTFMKD